MCWFYRVRYSCGGEIWGERQRQCARSVRTSGELCLTKRPARRIFDPSECPVCSDEVVLDASGGEDNSGVSWATAHETLVFNLFHDSNIPRVGLLSWLMYSTCVSDYISPSDARQTARRLEHFIRLSANLLNTDPLNRSELNMVEDRWPNFSGGNNSLSSFVSEMARCSENYDRLGKELHEMGQLKRSRSNMVGDRCISREEYRVWFASEIERRCEKYTRLGKEREELYEMGQSKRSRLSMLEDRWLDIRREEYRSWLASEIARRSENYDRLGKELHEMGQLKRSRLNMVGDRWSNFSRVRDRFSCLSLLRNLEADNQPRLPYESLASVLCILCERDPKHNSEHEVRCPQFACTGKPGHKEPHGILHRIRWCDFPDCTGELGHLEPHRMAHWMPCDSSGCSLGLGHKGLHIQSIDSRDLTARLTLLAKEGRRRLEDMNRKVLQGMSGLETLTEDRNSVAVQPKFKQQQQKFENNRDSLPHRSRDGFTKRNFNALSPYNPQLLKASSPYNELDRKSNQIRLFNLEPRRTGGKITGFFFHAHIKNCPSYTALSYAWGDRMAAGTIMIGQHEDLRTELGIAENLLCFLRVQSSVINEPKLFWIDAICINQASIHERNHQVSLMKSIYTNAAEVYVWLGKEADESKLAMNFISRGGPRALRPRGCGFHQVWTRREGRALGELCERQYWRRMWIIQEIIHADRISVWCGDQSADWTAFDNLYLTLRTLDEAGWSTHHRHALAVLQSSALTMVWQRAHWRHPETPVPTLQTLVEVFQEWKCSDLRDKIYALVSIASAETAVVPDYSRSARQVYLDVIKRDLVDRARFCNLLSQLLGLCKEDADLDEQNL